MSSNSSDANQTRMVVTTYQSENESIEGDWDQAPSSVKLMQIKALSMW